MFELPDRPGTLYKEYRRPVDLGSLEALVEWGRPGRLAAERLERVRRSTAWPSATVVADGAGPGAAVGLLMPRAPRRFSVRHRDGVARLATLSYLTADPVRRSAAYGVALPPQGDVQRLGLVYALARLLEVFGEAAVPVGHGDLSAKNVLWSLQRGPEVFVLDCDNGECFDPAGVVPDAPPRRRAMTPNWDDPSVPAGGNPGPAADRYSLALIFLRIVGAGHFPVQKRQKAGEMIDIELELPPATRRAATLGADAPLWALVSRSLSATDPGGRPPASTWAAALHDVLVDLGASAVVDAVHAAQGSDQPSMPSAPIAGAPAPDVLVRPAAARPRAPVWSSHSAPSPPEVSRPGAPSVRYAATPAGSQGAASPAPAGAPLPNPPALRVQLRAALATGFATWRRLHGRALRSLASRGRRAQGVRRLVACAVLDFALASFALLLVAMAVAPFLGI